MKRIVISIANSFDHDRRMMRIAKTLHGHGYEIKVIGKDIKMKSDRQTEISAYHINNWFKSGFLFYLEFNIRLFWKLLYTPADILLSVDSDTLLANTLASYCKRTPLIIDMHELFTEVPELADYPLKKSIWEWIERMGISRSSRRFTVSQTIANEYETRYGHSFEVIRNVPITQVPNPILKKHKNFTLIYIGALNMGRGLEQLIRSISKVPDVNLMICGTGDLDEELMKLVDQLSLKERIHFTGWVDPIDIQSHLQKAHVGINILDSSSKSYYLSLANKYFDYIHAGLPIISMNFPEYQMLNKMHGTSLLIDDINEETIINTIIQIKEDNNLYDELTANCQAAKKKWNWASESERLLSIFDL